MQSFEVTLDRVENNIAVLLVREKERKCEATKIDLPLSLLPPEAKEGDILDITITKNAQEIEESRERVSFLLEKLKSKNQKTDDSQSE